MKPHVYLALGSWCVKRSRCQSDYYGVALGSFERACAFAALLRDRA